MHRPGTSKLVGVGIDVIEISRIVHAMEDDAFSSVVLAPAERTNVCTPEWLAGRWAAKEAVAKAVGTHLRWHDVEIFDDERGGPLVSLRGPSQPRVHLSLSFGGGLACALAIAEVNQQEDQPH